MSAQTKKVARIGTKIVALFLFVFLVMFNLQIGIYDGDLSGISLFGFSLNVSTPSAMADGTCCPEANSLCVVDGKAWKNYYYKGVGTCGGVE